MPYVVKSIRLTPVEVDTLKVAVDPHTVEPITKWLNEQLRTPRALVRQVADAKGDIENASDITAARNALTQQREVLGRFPIQVVEGAIAAIDNGLAVLDELAAVLPDDGSDNFAPAGTTAPPPPTDAE